MIERERETERERERKREREKGEGKRERGGGIILEYCYLKKTKKLIQIILLYEDRITIQ